MKRDLLNRVITAAALVALAVTLGVWLTRSPLTAAPAAAPPPIAPLPPPVKSIRAAEALPEPTLAPPLHPAGAAPSTTTTEVEISYEIAPPSKTEKPAETPKANHQSSGRRGWFRRR